MLRTIYISTVPIDCHIIKGRLESEGINTFIFDEHLVWIYAFYSVAIGGVKLKVPADQFERASQILDLISENKLIDENGTYETDNALRLSIEQQNEILERKYYIRKDKTWFVQSKDIQSDNLPQYILDNLVKEEQEFRKFDDLNFHFSWKEFLAEIFDFEGRVFKYLHPKPVDYYLEKDLVEWYKKDSKSTSVKTCPVCKSDNVSYGYAIDNKWDYLYLILSLIIVAPFPLVRKNFHCFDCSLDFRIKK